MAANANAEGVAQKHLAEAVKRFARSIELCDDYLRGYYGLKTVSHLSFDFVVWQLTDIQLGQVTDKLLADSSKPKKQESEGFTLPDQGTLERLNQAATQSLGEIVRRYSAQEPLWQGYDAEEIAAARALLDKSTSSIARWEVGLKSYESSDLGCMSAARAISCERWGSPASAHAAKWMCCGCRPDVREWMAAARNRKSQAYDLRSQALESSSGS
jgi:hypothetical protein